MNSSSPYFIQNISQGLVDPDQVIIRADAGGEGEVIYDSAISTVQGLWPATTAYNETLANGTTVVGPLNGYQYILIESVEPDDDISLEGWTDCKTFTNSTEQFYASPFFKAKEQQSSQFLQALAPYLGGRPAQFENMWNIYDYVEVQSVHNATFAGEIPPAFVQQARDLANWHEYYVFSSPDPNSINTVAVRTFVPSLTEYINRIANSSDPLKFAYTAASYKPFISLFNVTGVAEMNTTFAGVVDFAASVALEVRTSPSTGPFIRFNFKNGTNDLSYNTYGIMGSASGDVPIQTFIDTLSPIAIENLPQWCNLCGNNFSRGCQYLQEGNVNADTKGLRWGGSVSPVGAGFLGAGLTVFVVGISVMVGIALGVLRVGKARPVRRGSKASSGELELVGRAEKV
ncbi:phosphoglycerate mutase-like protein [Thelephora terrestris]|uniref:Phosphoglycerate mutase-like protein n=1 Tax=Thelephora terrestris TaxID=56493 RepID=A0A9P6HB88_9AGAM|nr:phosphoglycerate mutase-like protein [Thelephora terrestris]